MNMKESFRWQNRISQLMAQARSVLSDERNVKKVTHTYMRNRVVPDAENEVTIDDIPDPEYADHITELAGFMMYLIGEKEKLSAAIKAAKERLPIDMDSEVSLNSNRQELADLFRRMTDMKSSEVLVYNGGTAYCFNAEGNQVSYKCPMKTVTTINFDRNKLRSMVSALDKKSDSVSVEIDKALINYEVEYTPAFDVNDSFGCVFEKYLGSLL